MSAASDERDLQKAREDEYKRLSMTPGAIIPSELYHEMNKAGIKFDSGKPNCDLVLGAFSEALMEVSKVGTFGANKYTPSGWLTVDNPEERYLSAMLRHYFAHKRGEIIDADSGLSHLAHMAWNALAALSFDWWGAYGKRSKIETTD